MDNMEGQFSRDFKENMRLNRFNDFQKLEIWLRENNIEFKNKTGFYFNIGSLTVYDNMKVEFFGSQKRYQYNLEGIKKRILTEV